MVDKATILILQGHLATADWPELAAVWGQIRARRRVHAQWSDQAAAPRVLPLEHWLCEQLGWQACALEGLQIWPPQDPPCPSDAYRVLLTPCHFMVRLDHVALRGLAEAPLAAEEASALCDSLQDGMEEWSGWLGGRLAIRCAGPMQWVAEVPVGTDLEGCSFALAEGLNVENYLPRGRHARVWRRILNQVQMLWHDHPVNHARERAGRPPVNALWWGGRLVPGEVMHAQEGSGVSKDSSGGGGARQVLRDRALLRPHRLRFHTQDPVLRGLASFLAHLRTADGAADTGGHGNPASANRESQKSAPEGLRELIVMALEPSALSVQTTARSLNEALRLADACAAAGEGCELVLFSDRAWEHLVAQPQGVLGRLRTLGGLATQDGRSALGRLGSLGARLFGRG